MSEQRTQESLSVAQVRGNVFVWKKRMQAMAYRGGHCFQEGYDQPTDDVS